MDKLYIRLYTRSINNVYFLIGILKKVSNKF